ncbi:hypothetical protein BDY21DRAFT_367396 [Lineolata rhizophorae]|uniref:Exonuclease domain-containing protein n=1 Tax=Lineolata rhizophorae TaxID=578093 RepID=A0A6A6NNP6_9PEZI|nr:hypothetical protein BDY21DRAFT_367396 [Lineolata rhizophorae]
MFTPKGLFRTIPCPKLPACRLPNCLFSHDPAVAGASCGADPDADPRPDAESGTAGTSAGGAAGLDALLRARRPAETGLDHGVEAREPGRGAEGEGGEEEGGAQEIGRKRRRVEGKGEGEGEREGRVLKSALRSVSPPPTTRKTTTTKAPAKQSSAASLSKQPSLAATKQQPPKKKESLNPRSLSAASPAPHQTRLILVHKLHETLSKINMQAMASKEASVRALVLSEDELVTRALDEEERVAKGEGRAVYGNLVKQRIVALSKMGLDGWVKEESVRREKVAAETAKEEDGTAESAHQNGSAGTAGKAMPNKSTPATPKPPPLLPTYKPSSEAPAITTNLTPARERVMLAHFARTISTLYFPTLPAHGYILDPPSQSAIDDATATVAMAAGFETCDRCASRFQVFPQRRADDGAVATGGACTFHWGRAVRPPRAKAAQAGASHADAEPRHACCDARRGEPGCARAPTHVFKTADPARLAASTPFVRTSPNDDVPGERAVALDCEMCYTAHGMELVRVTAVGWPGGELMLDVLVRPVGAVLDFNTRFSGIAGGAWGRAREWSEGDALVPEEGGGGDLLMASSPAHARALLLRLIAPSTPLVGHALENDLAALRLCHPSIVDSVLLYPVPGTALPMRFGLKRLVRETFGREIQVGGLVGRGAGERAEGKDAGGLAEADGEGEEEVRGHDSAEDARAAGWLVRAKVGAWWKRLEAEGWAWDGERLVAPPSEAERARERRLGEGEAVAGLDAEAREVNPFPKGFGGLRVEAGGTVAGKKRGRAGTAGGGSAQKGAVVASVTGVVRALW